MKKSKEELLEVRREQRKKEREILEKDLPKKLEAVKLAKKVFGARLGRKEVRDKWDLE